MATRSLTRSEAFDVIAHDRVLVIELGSDAPIYLRGKVYVRKIGHDSYRWRSTNQHGAVCGSWTWDGLESRREVFRRLESEHCIGQEHKKYRELKEGAQLGLRDPGR